MQTSQLKKSWKGIGQRDWQGGERSSESFAKKNFASKKTLQANIVQEQMA